MGAPESGMQAGEQSAGDSLLTAFRTIKSSERQKHATVLDYWLSIRGDKEFPPLHDLDPLEISDAGPSSILLELIGGGQDAEVRHLGDALTADVNVTRIIDAPNPSILSSIARKLPIVSISREFLAFEDSFSTSAGMTRCWVTLLPLSSCGSWVDYVYALVSVETTGGKVAPQPEPAEVENLAADEVGVAGEPAVASAADDGPEATDDTVAVAEGALDETPDAAVEPVEAIEPEPEVADEAPAVKSGPGFSKLLDGIANLAGFYGQGVNVDSSVPTLELTDVEPQVDELPVQAVHEVATAPQFDEPRAVEAEQALEGSPAEPEESLEALEPQVAEPVSAERPVEQTSPENAQETEPEAEPQTASTLEGPLQNQLAQVRAKAEEARQAQLRVTQALHESLSAAYDFALDAEGSPEEYLKLVEAQGVRIQLRAPMAPVARMAFDDVCDAATIRQFEAVLAWALKVELPRGALLERIESAGGIPELLNEFSKAA